VQVLRAAGFSNTEIEEDTRTQMQMLLSAGFTPDEVAIHYGNRQRDDSDLERLVNASGLEQAIQSVPELQDPTLWDALRLGMDSSVAGLLWNEGLPDAALAEDAGFHLELAHGVGVLVPDLPLMILGGTAGGGPITGMAGAFALPGGIRQVLMDSYSKGQMQNWDDFGPRLWDAVIATGKEATIGAATGGAGKLARVGLGKPLERMAASIPGKLGGSTAGITEAAAAGSEVVAMVGAGGAVHGEVPEAKDFALAAITIGLLRAGHKGVTATRQGAGRVMQQRANARENARLSAKFRRIYVRTGLNPREVVEAARRDPTIIEDLSSVNIVVPRALQAQVEGVDPRLVRAAEIVAGRGEAKASTLTKEMPDLGRADADALLGELEQAGVIGPRPPLFAGDRSVLATSEKQAQEMVKPAIELERATEAGGETYFRADSTNTQQRGGLIPLTTDRSVAEGYATAGEGAVAAYTVEVKNPLDMSRDSQVVAGLDAEGDPWAEAIINHAREEGSFYFWYMTKPVPYGEAWSEILIPQLRRLGYDGLRYVDDPQTGPVLAVFGREQMNPATEPVPSERAPDLDLELSGDAARAEASPGNIPWSTKNGTPVERAAAFDALPEDAEVTLYHATSEANAENIVGRGTAEPQRQGRGIEAADGGIYVGTDPISIEGMGPRILAVTVRKSQVFPSSEYLRISPDGTTGGALVGGAGTGGVVRGTPIRVEDVTDAGRHAFAADLAPTPRAEAPTTGPELDYRGQHTAPGAEHGAPMHEMDRMYPDDIYSPEGARYYGSGGEHAARDKAVQRLLVEVRGNPDAEVTVYRGVPEGTGGEIRSGDWVTPDRQYAEDHAARYGEGEIQEMTVRAGDLYTEGNSLYEFGWEPRAEAPAVTQAREAVEAIKRMKVAELREAGLMPEKGGRKRDLLEEAEKRLEEAEQVAREEPTPAEATALAEPTVPVEEVPSREPPRPFEEESLPEQIADVRALILEAETRGEQKRVDLIGRLSALDERLQRETVEPGSGQPSQGGKDAMDVVLSHISVGEKPAKRGWSLSQFYTHWKDGNYPLRVLGKYMEGGKDTREAIENEYSLARLFQGTRGKADHFIQFSPFKFGTYERVGRPLVQILKPVRKNLDGIRSYMVASRRLELYERAKAKHSEEEMAAILEEVGDVPIAEARRVVEEFGPELAPIAKDLYEYQDHVLQYARDGGLITPEAYEMMTELNKNYVPFFRVMLEEGAAGGAPSGNSFFRINVEGSGLKIHDPIESIIKNTHSVLHAVERNAISDAYINHVEKVAGQGGIEVSDLATRVKPRMKKTRLGADEMKKLANKLRDGDKLTEDQRAALEQETLDIFRPDTLLPGQNQIVRFKDGERQVWEVPPEIAEVLQITSHEEMNMLVKILSVPATTLRAGAVLSPEFMLANPFRDSIVSFIQSDSGYKAFADTLWGAAAVLGKTRLYQDWMRSGGAQSELVALDRVFKGSDVEGVLGGGNITMRNVIRSPIEGLRVLSQMSEQMTRVGEFGRALHPEKGTLGLAKETGEDIAARLLGQEMLPREASKGDIMKSGLRSRDVSLDFGRMGSRAQAVNKLIAFLNASLEGTVQMLRTMKDHPARTMLRGTALLTVPALTLQATNQGEYGWSDWDEEEGRYKPSEHIPQWQRDLYFIWPTYAEDDDGNILLAPDGSGRPLPIWHRLPAGYGYGMIFKALPQRMWDRIANEDPNAFDDYMTALLASVAVPFVGQFALPALETWANRSLFTGAPVIPAHLEGVLPEYQATPRTNSISRLIGGFLSDLPLGASQVDLPIIGTLERSPVASPMIIDHTVRALTGGLGSRILRESSRLLEDMDIIPEPPGRMADTPSDVIGLGAFAVRIGGGELSRKFWDRVKENDQVHRTVNMLMKQARPLEAQKLMQKHAGSAYTVSGAPIALPGIVGSLQMLTQMRSVYDLPIPGMTAEERLDADIMIKNLKLMFYRAGLDQFEAMSAMPGPRELEAPTEARVNP
jgi:hypothetical protein